MVTQLLVKPVIVVGLALCVILTGCRQNDYGDTISFNSGDAIARNKAVQTIDPWPRNSFRKHHQTNGERILKAYGKYQDKTPDAASKKEPKK